MPRRKRQPGLFLITLGLAISFVSAYLLLTRIRKGPAANDYTNRHSGSSQQELPLRFFALVFALSVPFWLIGGNRLPLPINLPASALAVFNPLIAAAILTYRRDGLSGTRQLLSKTFDAKKIENKIWYVPIMLALPATYSLSYIAMRLTRMPLPDPKIPLLMVPGFFLIYFISAAGEELGWTGYAIEPLQARWGALKASLVLGSLWGLWHVVPDVQARRRAGWILWQRLYSVSLRVLIVWTYNNTGGSVFAAILMHTMDNVSWSLFPNYGSHYNPFLTCMIAGVAAIMVVLGWGPKTLARYRGAG